MLRWSINRLKLDLFCRKCILILIGVLLIIVRYVLINLRESTLVVFRKAGVISAAG